MKNDINLAELQEWLSDEEVTYASSSRERKRLTVSFNGTLKVMVDGKTVWQGIQPFSAVEAYNTITEKYVAPKFEL